MSLSLLVRVALFMITFTIEVRVKAAESSFRLRDAARVTTQPENCLTQKTACAVATKIGEKFVFEFAGGKVVLDQDSAVVRVSENELRVLRGSSFVIAKKTARVSSEFGWVELARGGEVWLTKTPDQLKVLSLREASIMHPLGTAETLEVPCGMMNWMAAVAGDGRAQSGIPMSVVLEPVLKDWARIYPGSRSEFEKDAHSFYEAWAEAVESAASLHKALFDRKVASLEDAHVRQTSERKKIDDRNRYFREMFRKKVFEE